MFHQSRWVTTGNGRSNVHSQNAVLDHIFVRMGDIKGKGPEESEKDYDETKKTTLDHVCSA